MIPWIPLLLVAGCAILPDRPTASTDATWPHADNYGGGLHGVDALKDDARCDACHGGRAPTGPACDTCHPDYPHPAGWRAGDAHGQDRSPKATARTEMQDPLIATKSSCMPCHGDPLLTAGRDWSCTSCHASYPHPAAWGQAAQHGLAALARGDIDASCGSCHAEPDQPVAAFCWTCHADYPHAEGWDDGQTHGAAWNVNEAACTTCHGEGGAGGKVGVTCARCHAVWPHPSDFASTHVAQAAKVGEPVCLTCHEGAEAPATMIATCSPACHGGGR